MADLPSSSNVIVSNTPLAAEHDVAKTMKLKLEASDGRILEVDSDVAFKSKLLEKMISDLGITEADDPRLDDALPITSVDGPTLEKLMTYCEQYRKVEYIPKGSSEDPRIYLSKWDEDYVNITDEELTALVLGANYLDIQGVIDITTQKIANLAQGKSVEELRVFFNLTNDFTPEKEAELRERFSWIDY